MDMLPPHPDAPPGDSFLPQLTESETGSRAPQPRLRVLRAEVDEELLRRAIQGEPAALEAFVRHYQQPLFAFLSRSTGVGTHVEDLAQEVMLRACRALPRFVPGPAKVSTWIFRIAVRLIQDQRKQKRPLHVAVPHDLGERASSVESRVADRRTLSVVERLLNELGTEQRMALVLTEFHGLSQAEVAQIMSCELATVKTRVHRARAFLREGLRKAQGETR